MYDVTANAGFISVGIASDTAEFAMASIRCWLERMGRKRYPQARELTITADCGGSNGARARLWKLELCALERARLRVLKPGGLDGQRLGAAISAPLAGRFGHRAIGPEEIAQSNLAEIVPCGAGAPRAWVNSSGELSS